MNFVELTALLAALVVGTAEGYIVNYYLHEKNDASVDSCIQSAISDLGRETCLLFQHNPDAQNAIIFVQSRSCGFQESNSTVHLGKNCINPETCLQYVHHAIVGERKHHSMVARSLNLKFNCTDKCTKLCENGGTVTPQCTCRCPYGFAGENCEQLKMRDQFTDPTCGIVNAKSQGEIALSDVVEKTTFCQWVLKTDDPFQTFELEIEELDLNNDNKPPGQPCGDFLYVYGVTNIVNPFRCGDSDSTVSNEVDDDSSSSASSSLVGTRYTSTGNMLFIEFRGNSFSSRPHKGPVFKYTVVNPIPMRNEFPPMKYAQVTAGALSAHHHVGAALAAAVASNLVLAVYAFLAM